MTSELLETIVDFTHKKRSEGKDVYLGQSGVPFTAEGAALDLENLRVDLEAIGEELAERDVAVEKDGK